MHDGLELETRGIPTAVICTEPFRPTVAAILSARSAPDYPFVVLQHPIGSLTEEELRDRTEEAARQVAEVIGLEFTL